MITEAQYKKLDAKLDRVLELLGGKQVNTELDDLKAVLATGGVEAFKQYAKSMPKGGK